jgi:hypothetical protein
LIQKIKDKYAANGNKPFSLLVVTHGGKGRVTIGNGDDFNNLSKPRDWDDFAKSIKGLVTEIHFFSCCTGDVNGGGMEVFRKTAKDGNFTMVLHKQIVNTVDNGKVEVWNNEAEDVVTIAPQKEK